MCSFPHYSSTRNYSNGPFKPCCSFVELFTIQNTSGDLVFGLEWTDSEPRLTTLNRQHGPCLIASKKGSKWALRPPVTCSGVAREQLTSTSVRRTPELASATEVLLYENALWLGFSSINADRGHDRWVRHKPLGCTLSILN